MDRANINETTASTAESHKKRSQRRILSCDTCRRAKTRCDFNPRHASCDRCQKLRIKCSLSTVDVPGHPSRTVNNELSLDERVTNIETSLSEVKDTMEKLCTFLQNLQDRPQISRTTPTNEGPDPSSEIFTMNMTGDKLENIQFPHLLSVRSETAKSTPVMMVRKFRSKNRRLYKDESHDIIDKNILSEDDANMLVLEFVRRQGKMLQIGDSTIFTPLRNLRRRSPLLYAVCCLHGLRFCKDPNIANTVTHRHLYEEVRDMLGQAVLASPLPIEELYAILIMCTFEAAPKPVFEYIESWLLSGICAKQAILGIDFAQIIQNMEAGKFYIRDKQYISFWNNTCLINLRFAVGTGNPPTIPADYMKQCPAILNNPLATEEDGIILAEILLFSTLYHKLGNFPFLDKHGRCNELNSWEDKWNHLLVSPRAITLRFSHDIAYLMLARHSLEGADRRSRTKITTDSLELKSRNEISSTAQTTNNGENETKEAFHSLARHYAVSLANKFLQEPITAIQELPKFHHICIAYCALVLSEYASYCEISDEELLSLLQRLQEHYYEFSGEVPPAMNIAVERVKLCIRSKAPVCPSYRASLSMNHTATTSPAPEMHSESDITGEAVYQNGELQSVNMQDAGMEGPTDNIYDDLGYSTGLDDIGGMGTLFDGHFMSFMDFFNNNI